MNAKANQLAHYLQSIGVGAEVMVGLCLERSLDLIIGILGILKAGGAYVPIDPAYPQERIAFMLEDTELQFVVTQQQWLVSLTENSAAICLDRDWQKIDCQSSHDPVSGVTAENLAYLIYTSGSTGKPKGVQMPHSSVTAYLQAIAKILPVNHQDIYLHTASFSFTASVRQLFLPLSQGATSILATREQTRTPLSLFELIQKRGVTISDGVPSVWRYGLIALESLEQKYTKALGASKLRLIVFGGELLPYQLIKKLRNLFKTPPQFFNILGQTESIGHGFYPIPDDCNLEDGYVPVGYPLPDIQQVYVLNSQLEPVKIGESGEVHIAGSTLARGYLNRTEANGEKFIINPFNPQQRLFKTGDVARYSSNQNLEILGRIDFQVNIRGMRVELEEIEAVIKLHPSIQEAVVSAREDVSGGKRLVAYIVVNNQDFNSEELRNFLSSKLPDYMIPHTLMVMEKLPVLPNGKLDRNSLPEPDLSAIQSKFVPPQTPTQEIIANIWSEVLGIEKVGIHDNFLELGGHSLLASLVISRLREALSIEISIASLFAAPTIATFSEKIGSSAQNLLPNLEPVARNIELPLSLTQQRFWFLDQMEGANSAYNIVRVLNLQGSLNFTALEEAIATIINRHETLRTSFGIADGKPIQIIAGKLEFTLPVIDLQELAEDHKTAGAQKLITNEYLRPFELNESSLLRVTLMRLGEKSHQLLIIMHHIISDAWSVGNFLQELSVIYSALTAGLPSPLTELSIQYADYAYWQRQWLENQPALDYWKQQLADIPAVIELPTDRSRTAMQTFSIDLQKFQFDSQLTHKLKNLSQKSGSSLFMTLLTAFVILLSRYSGQEDIVIGSPISNRNRVALEPLIGFCVNTLVLRTRLEGNPTFIELLQQVRQMALDAYAHQDVPFDQLVETLQPQRHLSHSPLFQVMFVLQNSPVSKLELGDLQVTQKDFEIEIASQSYHNPINNFTPENLAYVIYTSGSTGRPKGVLIQHSALLNLVFWHLNNFEVKSSYRATHLAGTAFDAAVWELWPYLVVGASIYLIKSEFLLSAKTLQEKLLSHNITISFIPTPLAEQLCLLSWTENTTLRTMLTGGDRLNSYPSNKLPFKFFNNYGPTENTVVTTSGQILPAASDSKFPPIGRPIANTQVYILDPYLQPLPIGVYGEIYIGGLSLARGYLNRPDLTSERFIANPFVANERLYKTGDLGRYLPDGNIEFLGRIDHQVKIRGFRIELGEIETVLTQHPQVQQVVVIVREDYPGNKYLTAYIVSATETLTSSELRQFLKGNLPEYMIPAAFVMLKALPLTPNGKVDRLVLPKPEITNSELETAFVAPGTALETKLAEIWCTVLHREQVGIYDNFFELGGHSLLITSVISRIQEHFSIVLPLRSLFTAPTIAELSQVIIAHQLDAIKVDTLPPLVPQARDTCIPLSFAQESIWYLQQLAPESCAYNSFFILRFTGSLSAIALESSFNEIIRRHEILRTAFTIVEGQPVQVITPFLTIPLEIIDLQNLPLIERTSEAERLAALQYNHHFDLALVPLIKTSLLRLTPEEHWLTINMHHIITDGWSFGLLLEELGILYAAFVNGLPSPLPELPVHYADFTLWQRQYFNEKVIEKQLAYWLQKLTNTSLASDQISSNQLPLSNENTNAAIYSVVLPASIVTSIEALCRSQKVSIFVIILTALNILLFKYSSKNDILVVTTIGNRSAVETEKMLGCFINDVILRSALRSSASLSHLSSEQTGQILLEQAQETLTEAINNKEIACHTVIETITSKQRLNISASLTMLPPQNWHNWMLDVDFVTIKRDLDLWDGEIPLEIYVSSPSVNNPTMEIKVFYSTELFTNQTIEVLFGYYQQIFQQLVKDPTSQVCEFFDW
ncbi:non-ribosomal peptide synthetase [Dolichospermum circinale]|uniref:non-ribosomal peptide synthetase n=1 Tax=Dolichospermum circinale TaxID=109265 RepID=UPI00232F3DF6|nr:non-ribosomal peptide synthetase [Dolichospermum circinale]MDB9465838.1 amino acid adenylation domain-containing protein [Dolichospermum circinale CS-539/09]MDB9470308.1 amino acid adenylation domain-containing protein [Dolichospermum circinale CS-539]